MDNQDWNPVTIKRTYTKKEEKQKYGVPTKKKAPVVSSTSTGQAAHTIEKEDYKPPLVTKEIGQQIIQARLAKKWNQEQLARESQLPISVIKTFEVPTSNTILNNAYLQKISRALGVQIKRS